MVPEGLSAGEVGHEIAHHREHAARAEATEPGHEAEPGASAPDPHKRRDHLLTITEAVLLSIVAVTAAYSGYAAAKWGTEGSLSVARASATRTKANRAQLNALQIRTLDAVEFNAAFTAFVAHDATAFRIAVRRLRPGYRPAFNAWLATHPATNPNAPPGPAYMPQYRIPQQAQSVRLDAQADAAFKAGEDADLTGDKYVRTTVFLATVLFLVGISSHFPLRSARYGLIVLAFGLLGFSIVQLTILPGLPG
jgi:hypothetical protein